MKGRNFAAVVAFGVMLAATVAFSQSKPPIEGPAVGETPAWFLQGSFPDPTGRTIVEPGGKVTVPARAGGAGGRGAGGRGAGALDGRISGGEAVPRHALARRCAGAAAALRGSRCSASNGNRRSATRSNIHTYFRPVSAESQRLRSIRKGNLWVFQRADEGKPQLFKFDPNYKLILQVGPDVIGYQTKAHGMAVDAEDNVWITAAGTATVTKISPDGKVLLTSRRTRTPGRLG